MLSEIRDYFPYMAEETGTLWENQKVVGWGQLPGPARRSDARFHASGGQQFTIAPEMRPSPATALRCAIMAA